MKAKKIECLKVDDDIFQPNDIVEIDCGGIKVKEIYVGRIDRFVDIDSNCPPGLGIVIDISKKFKHESVQIPLRSIKSVKLLNRDNEEE